MWGQGKTFYIDMAVTEVRGDKSETTLSHRVLVLLPLQLWQYGVCGRLQKPLEKMKIFALEFQLWSGGMSGPDRAFEPT